MGVGSRMGAKNARAPVAGRPRARYKQTYWLFHLLQQRGHYTYMHLHWMFYLLKTTRSDYYYYYYNNYFKSAEKSTQYFFGFIILYYYLDCSIIPPISLNKKPIHTPVFDYFNRFYSPYYISPLPKERISPSPIAEKLHLLHTNLWRAHSPLINL